MESVGGFPKCFEHQFLHPKLLFFDRKARFFKQKIPARAPQLEARSGIGLSCKVFCYERTCRHFFFVIFRYYERETSF